MKHLTPASRATLALSLVFASFHLVCLAEARNSINATLTTHHPDPGTLEQCPSKLLLMWTSARRQPGAATLEWMNMAGSRPRLAGACGSSPSSCSVWIN
ncbi:transmembrane protein 213 isoform X3 [Felis catus]|uniref:transmembrane protein 213 isoform X3 n=1 Tax=Felis catus TaxID=9685 RepID=UPI001D198C1A|nr:transmembrane protein 213 isoform X3 [Felis catus]